MPAVCKAFFLSLLKVVELHSPSLKLKAMRLRPADVLLCGVLSRSASITWFGDTVSCFSKQSWPPH